MTPLSFAVLGLRLMAAWMLLFVQSHEWMSVIQMILLPRQYGGENAVFTWVAAAYVLIITLIWLGLWFRAKAFAAHLLPSGSVLDEGDYAAWERLGLQFFGCLMASQAFLSLLVWPSGVLMTPAGDWVVTAFYLLAALHLIFDLRILVRAARRLLRTNWWTVLMQYRARLQQREH
jgi:hypothetical protein